jgi:hypothetical protein
VVTWGFFGVGLPIKQYQEQMGHSYKPAMAHYIRYRPEEVLDML